MAVYADTVTSVLAQFASQQVASVIDSYAESRPIVKSFSLPHKSLS